MAAVDWKDEMNTMLAAFNHQTIHSLKNINNSFKQHGLSFNPEFRKYFLEASNRRIEDSFDQFHMDLKMKNQLDCSLSAVATQSPLEILKPIANQSLNVPPLEMNDSVKATDFNKEISSNALNTPSTSPILRLDVDCLEEIFDFLSVGELHAIGQTCKRMQSFAEYFFRENYSDEGVNCEADGIYMHGVRINGFTRFVRNIEISEGTLENFRFIESNPFDSIDEMCLTQMEITDEKMSCLENVLSKIETLKLYECKLDGYFYEHFLKCFLNLKKLIITTDLENNLINNGSNWLLREYPNLEYFGLFKRIPGDVIEIRKLKTFFENNSSNEKFGISIDFLIMNDYSFLETYFKVDELAVDCSFRNVKFVQEILNKLWEKGSFKKLNLKVNRIDHLKEMDLLPPISDLQIWYVPEDIAWEPLTEMKELHIDILECGYINKMVKNLINMEKIILINIRINHILAFMRHLPKLTVIRVEKILHIDSEEEVDEIDVVMLNNERKKLPGARKVVIYVEERMYLALKWKKNGTEQSMVQIKRK